jgi:hypothetical protein
MSGCKCTGRDNRNKITTHNLQEDEALMAVNNPRLRTKKLERV